MSRSLVVAPASPIVSVADAKEHLRVSTTDEDDLIGSICMAASETVDHLTNQAIVRRTYRESVPCFTGRLSLAWPLVSITSVKYLDGDAVEQTVLSSGYAANFDRSELYFLPDFSEPPVAERDNAVQVTYVSGYEDEAIPEAAVAACKLLIGDMYEHREAQAMNLILQRNPTVDRLTATLRIPPR